MVELYAAIKGYLGSEGYLFHDYGIWGKESSGEFCLQISGKKEEPNTCGVRFMDPVCAWDLPDMYVRSLSEFKQIEANFSAMTDSIHEKAQEIEYRTLAWSMKNQDHQLFRETVSRFSPNELNDLEKLNPQDFEHFCYMLWSASPTWGFEILWAGQYTLPESQRDPAVDLPALENLTPDKPLGEHLMWAPQDQLTRLQPA